MTNKGRTTCVVVGGGPAGMVLGLLLARAGVAVTVLEKHKDFLRDFRGDTVHASTLDLLDELGLGPRFAQVPHRRIEKMRVQFDEGAITVADMRRLPGTHKHIALVPQWDFLDLLADAASEEPTFTLLRNAEVTDIIRDGRRVTGVRYRDRVSGADHEIRATLTVACDGRGSDVRVAAGLVPRSFGVPMDIWWFRLSRRETDPIGVVGRISTGQMCGMIDRGGYWQCAYVIRKGTDGELRAAGIEELRRRFAALLPWMADRVPELTSFDRISLLDVQLNRLRRWYTDGLLLIGDAAHAMSPAGGVGINLAVADAVAAARILGPALRSGGIVPRSMLRRVQRRRLAPTAIIQAVQRLAHRGLLGPGDGRPDGGGPGWVRQVRLGEPVPLPHTATAASVADSTIPDAPLAGLPLPLRLTQRFPVLQGIPARLVAIGPLPEHAPSWARRPAAAARTIP